MDSQYQTERNRIFGGTLRRRLLARWRLQLVLAVSTALASSAFAQTPIAVSADVPLLLGTAQVYTTDEDVVADDGLGGITFRNLGTLPDSVDVIAYARSGANLELMVFDEAVQLGGIMARTGDVVSYDGSNYSIVFDPTENFVDTGVRIDALSIAPLGLTFSFDTDVQIGGVEAADEDFVRWEGGAFSLAFDGSANGVPRELNVDAGQDLLGTGFLMSFDDGGLISGIVFSDEDVLRFENGVWSMEFDASASDSDWGPANLDAVFVPEPTRALSLLVAAPLLVWLTGRRRRWVVVCSISALGVFSMDARPAAAAEGQLEISHTCATLTGCFPGDVAGYPVSIVDPGSYVLTGNLLAPAGQAAIFPTTGNFSLDLGGFEIAGPVVCTGSGTTISCAGNSGSGVAGGARPDVTVFNGFVHGFGFNGIATGDRGRVYNVTVDGNGNRGISTGANSIVHDAITYRNETAGVFVGDHSIVEHVYSAENGADGINAGIASTVTSNVTRENGDDGVDTTSSSVVRGNIAAANSFTGIETGIATDVAENLAIQNGAAGIRVGNGAAVQNNLSSWNTGLGVNFAAGTEAAYRANDLRNNSGGTSSGTALNLGSNLP